MHNFGSFGASPKSRNRPSGQVWAKNYKVGDRIMVSFKGGIHPNKMRVLEVLENSEYLVYHQSLSKKDARLVTSDQILGLDPDR